MIKYLKLFGYASLIVALLIILMLYNLNNSKKYYEN